MAVQKQNFFHRISPTFCVLALLVPAFIQTPKLWSFDRGLLVGPLNADIFSLGFELFRNHRIVLSPHLAPALSFFYTYLSSALLITAFYLTRFLVSGRGENIFAFAATAFFIPLAQPGLSTVAIAPWIGGLLLSLAVYKGGTGLRLWALAGIGIVVGISQQKTSLLIFWTIGTILLAELLHFLLVDRLVVNWRTRETMGPSILRMIAWTILSSTTLILAVTLLPVDLELHPSRHAWIAFITVGISILLAWLEPWQSRLWLATATFPWILYLTNTAEKSVWILSFVLLVRLLQTIFQTHEKFWTLCRLPLLSLGTAMILFTSIRYTSPNRDFDLQWLRAAHELPRDRESNLLVLSDAFPFVAQVMQADIFFDPSTLLITDEKKLIEWMDKNKVSQILVEKDFFLSFWKKWLQTDQPPDTSNRSVISRIIWYKGQALDIRTLKEPAITTLTTQDLKTTDHFIVIAKQK